MMIIGGVDMAVYGGARQRYDTADDHRRCGRQRAELFREGPML